MPQKNYEIGEDKHRHMDGLKETGRANGREGKEKQGKSRGLLSCCFKELNAGTRNIIPYSQSKQLDFEIGQWERESMVEIA